MTILTILARESDGTEGLPPFVRTVEDISGVRVIRLEGPVGKAMAPPPDDSPVPEKPPDIVVFRGSAIFDFARATDCDFVTVSLLVLSLRDRLAVKARVGLINAPAELLAELRIAKLESVIESFDSETQAIQELARSTAESQDEQSAQSQP